MFGYTVKPAVLRTCVRPIRTISDHTDWYNPYRFSSPSRCKRWEI